MAPQQIQISFQGANWILHDDTVKILSQYSSMFEEIPEIAYFFGGFLWSDYIQSIKTYFWVIAAIWSALSVGCGFCVGIISLFIYCLPLFIKKRFDNKWTFDKNSKSLKLGMILFFTYHRIKAYMTPAKGFLIITLCLFILYSFPKLIAAIIFPCLMSSLLIKTENIVDFMTINQF